MNDYIQKIIRVFTASEHKEKVTGEVHQWLLEEKYADEKDAALKAVWEETEGIVDTGTWKSLAAVYNKIGVNGNRKSGIPQFFWRYTAAAILLIAISISGTFYIVKSQYSEVVMVENMTKAGRLNHLQLPDGSFVQTNSGTIVLYPEKFTGNTRTVYLIGEANFKVVKNPDKPFIVRSADMAVTALGTEFNVAAYPENDEMVATLIHGKIKVDCNYGEESYILNPGQQVVYQKDKETSQLADANLDDVVAWQKGMVVFRGKKMKEILTTLERRYAVTFQYNGSLLNEDKYNFRFRERSTIEDVMNIMQEVVGGFDYKLEGNIC